MSLKLVRYIVALSLFCVCFISQAQEQDLLFPIPEDDGNPFNQSNKSGLYFNDPPNIQRTIEYDPVTG